ncbi:spore germination protein [Paenibacillus sp. 1P07SE]|uniref:spore germination protein n=1 Tax=Paenibacillus sp. 1P07SE TaxID=3132209 RepID=UPI0039A5A00B
MFKGSLFQTLTSKLTHGRKQRMNTHINERSKSKLDSLEEEKLPETLTEVLDKVKDILRTSNDLVIREFYLGQDSPARAAVIFIDGLSSAQMTDQFILKAGMFDTSLDHILSQEGKESSTDRLENELRRLELPINELEVGENYRDLIFAVLSGDSAVVIDGLPRVMLLNTKGWVQRGIEEPSTESVVRGPRDSFTETIRTNTAMIRRRLRDPNLCVESMSVGRRSVTDIAIMYLADIVDPKLVQEIRRRIQEIDIDAVLESGYIEQFIEDHHISPFPIIQNTERPDKAVANILEGRVIIISDGTPFVLIAPSVFAQFYQSPEDYYERFLIGTLIRLIRIVSMGMALLLPSLYIAFSSYHPEMIPSRLVIAMAAGRSTVPFPSIIEAFLMEVTMEILREASVRLPGPIGPTIGIVGALVVGQAAVQAGIVSPIMVIIVALTTIGSFASPSYSAAISLRMLRFPMMIAASLFGLYGIMLLLIIIIIHLCTLKSFGVSYLSPMTPMNINANKDTLIRAPLQWMSKRPKPIRPKDAIRVGNRSGEADKEGETSNATEGSTDK